MRVRFEILVLGALCSMIVTPVTRAQTPDPASTVSETRNFATDIPKKETLGVPAPESPEPDASPSSSRNESTERPRTTRAVDVRQRDQFERALPHIIKAEGLFENDMFKAAAAEYKRASEILEGHPKYYQTQYNLGLCYERLFRYTKALEYYENYLESPELETPNRIEVEELIKTLRELLATLRISVNVKAAVWVDGRLIGQAPGELLVAGGRHRVELSAEGYETEQLEVHVPAQTVRKLTFEMEATERFQGIDPIYFWVSSALAVTAFGIGGYFGIDYLLDHEKALDAYRQKVSEAENHESDDLQEEAIDANQKLDDLRIRADVFFAIGAGLAIGSVILFFLTDWGYAEESSTISHVRPSLSITTSVSQHSVHGNLSGRFETPFF